MKQRLSAERGNVMVTVILVISVMMSLGIATAARVDTQTSQSRTERERESSFNLAEAALSAQTFILGRRGTGTLEVPYPTECGSELAAHRFCPDHERLMDSYDSEVQVDFGTDTEWVTQVRDDADVSGQRVTFWDDSYLDVPDWKRYDADDNRHVWVRSEATVRGETRAIVAWVRIEDRVVSFPQYTVLAGYLDGKNSGGHGGRPLVDSTGSLGIAVRCSLPPQSDCIDLDPTKGPQLQPPGKYDLEYPRTPAIDRESLAALEEVAKANGTWYETCPDTPPDSPNGDVVYVKNAGTCRFTSNTLAAPGATKCCNTQADPGLFILEDGTVDFGGNIEFWGVVYHANLANRSLGRMIETSGTAAIHGGAIVDGDGGVYAGSSGDNIMFYAFAFEDIRAAGTAGVVQNTWREIVPPANAN